MNLSGENKVLKAQRHSKHAIHINPHSEPEFILSQAKAFLKSLEDLRTEITERDAAFAKAKATKSHEDMARYHELAKNISKKCLDYGRNLCDDPIPHWVDGNLSKDNIEITRHAYDVIRNKICASSNVFDSDLMPNAKILLDFAEGKF